MIELDHLSLRRGSKLLLEDAALRINPGENVALIGANGSGKSSLFALLRGELETDRGECRVPGTWRISHMNQEVATSKRCALDFVLDGHTELRAVEAALATCTDDSELAKLHERLDDLHAWEQPALAEKLLQGLGFDSGDATRAVNEFSGGWRVRLNLAQALLRPSELLLLDEPTNHLDVDACFWLEQWLAQYPGTLLLISHDRDFIDNCCDTVAHLEHRQLKRYRGNYSDFERQRAEYLAQQQSAYEKQQRERAHMEDFVRRFRAKATKARQAQSRLKSLARMAELAPAHIDSPFSFSFYEPGNMSDPLLGLRDATLGYQGEDKPTEVLHNVGIILHPESRIGLLGANGRGKSTLLKSLAGELALLAGERTGGMHLKIGYFSQHQLEALDLDASPLVQLQRVNPAAREQDIRNFLGGFNFRNSMADSHCRDFSGGEKARLALALIVWQRPNLLLLDEPTNHLDLDMCRALTVALQSFAGAVLVVSHDRHLLRNTAEQFLLVKDGRLQPFDGSIDDYRQFLLDPNGRATKPAQPQQPAVSKSGAGREARQASAARRAELAPLTRAIRKNEERTARKQAELRELEAQLGDPGFYDSERSGELQDLLRQQGQLRQLIETLEEEWLALQEQLEARS